MAVATSGEPPAGPSTTIPSPGWWMAFTGTGDGTNLVCNMASIPHDPAEAVNVDLAAYPLA